jgi:hypothetical protein
MIKEKEKLSNSGQWRKWGPYLSDRQWGTVREDYSSNGDAWSYFPFEHSLLRAYRWGEDGIGGISDSGQLLCFAPAFWNGNDEIIKERLFGLSNHEGNHGEDVKECYYYLDNLPSHSYMKMLYKYPQNAFPYSKLLEENKQSGLNDPEFELTDTGIFSNNKYFDIFIEYCKTSPSDILIRITAFNRSKSSAYLNILPQLWFRNTWSWNPGSSVPCLKNKNNHILAEHVNAETMFLYYEDPDEVIFCDNNTNTLKLYNHLQKGYFKDGINDYVIHKISEAVNTSSGTKAALNYKFNIKGGESAVVKLRLTSSKSKNPFSNFNSIFNSAIKDADNFYDDVQKEINNEDERNIQRQAFAGLLWSKQFYSYNIREWINGDELQPPPPEPRKKSRNSDWFHLDNNDIILMPDKWEYPWYATWDLAFHCIPMVLIDPELAKEQLLLFTGERYLHPNGQLPAYEWNFNDVNPPVHAWAAWRVYKIDEKISGKKDILFLERIFLKLLLNFTWWVNKKDINGRNIFQGGFLGMDNIGIFDRSHGLNSGEHLDQADGTSWMGMYSLNLMRIALELSAERPHYQDMAIKFFEHFLYIAKAMTNIGDEGIGLWDEEDQFYYDVLHSSSKKNSEKLRVRSMVGLIPLFAVEVLEHDLIEHAPLFSERLNWLLENRADLAALVSRWREIGTGERNLLSLLRGSRMKKLIRRMLDETEYLSCNGVRSLSKVYGEKPYEYSSDGMSLKVKYTPAEADTEMFGGNSNWRGPVWMPVNFLIIESLQRFHHYYGDDFKIEYPINSGSHITIKDAADILTERLINIFRRNSEGKRPVYGSNALYQDDPFFRDYILFYEYFNGDTGEGLGASHQTGWTALIAKLIQPRKD